MSILSAFGRYLGMSANGSAIDYGRQVTARAAPVELPPAALYRMLKSLYLVNGCYDELRALNYRGDAVPSNIRPIRNVVTPVIDFWGAKLWPDPLEIETENERILPALEQIDQWSNWLGNRDLFASLLALYGEMWVKSHASAETGRAWHELIEPQYIADFTLDPRDFVTMVRLDVPQSDEAAGGGMRSVTHTEVWEVATDDYPQGRYQVWRTDGDASTRALRDLGSPVEDATLAEFGIDFVPFVRTTFRDIGEKRGIGAVQLALEAIMSADLNATNLHATLFQDLEGAWVLKATGLDANQRPLPAPVVQGAATTTGTGTLADGSVQVGKRSFWRLGGGQELQSVIPNIDYAAALAVLQDDMTHLERLMPALVYSKISELSGGDLSGRAIRYKAIAASNQVGRTRKIVFPKSAAWYAQTLTLGQVNGIFGTDIGTYEAGEFAFTYKADEIFPLSGIERAEEAAQEAQAFSTLGGAGFPLRANLARTLNLSEDEAEDVMALAVAQAGAGAEIEPEGER